MSERRTYTIGENRIQKGYSQGFAISGSRLHLTEGAQHIIFLPVINSFQDGCSWGRLRMKAALPEQCTLIISAFALDGGEAYIQGLEERMLDERVSLKEKRSLFEGEEAFRAANCPDILLYSLHGRCLFLSIEAAGTGEGCLEQIVLENPGDNFMQTFPEIYQREGEFFHRYMSIFSSIYREVQEEIENLHQILELNGASRPLLEVYAGWLGVEVQGGFLEDEMLETLLKNAYRLNRMKGSKRALEELIELLTGQKPVIVERNLIDDSRDRAGQEGYNRLYGDNKQDVTVLMNGRAKEKLQAQLMYLLNQYKPARTRLRLIFHGACNCLDSYCFLDRNAALERLSEGYLDTQAALDGSMILT